MALSQYRVPSSLDEVFYIPEFITEREEEYLLRKINESSSLKWKMLHNRRLQIWGGELTPSNVLIPRTMPSFVTQYPNIIQRLRETGVFAKSRHGGPNHIIVNEYTPGQGIMPHEDGPSYYPVVATLSLGSHTVFHYHQYAAEPEHSPMARGKPIDSQPVLSLLLEPRSLVITTKSLYTNHLHSIEPVERDVFTPAYDKGEFNSKIRVANWESVQGEKMRRIVREGGTVERSTRVSSTCRDVERVIGGIL